MGNPAPGGAGRAAPTAAAAISAAGLSIDFGSLRAVDDLHLSVAPGVVYGFLGPNGAGKSTTIRLLLGLLAPTSGTAAIIGHDIVDDGDGARASCGVLLDDDGLYDRLTASENLDFVGRIWKVPNAERSARTATLLDHIGLADRADDRVGSWSMGMRKKLAVARAVYHRPPVVFLDEPTNGLDPLARKALREDIVSLARQQGSTVFVTTHDLDDAERMCDRVGVMVTGRLIAEGSPDELRSRARSSQVQLRGSGFGSSTPAALDMLPEVAAAVLVEGGVDVTLRTKGGPAAPVVAAAVASGCGIEEVRRSDDSLEDAFVALLDDGTDDESEGATP